MATAIFPDLNNEQANGLACIVCNADFTITGIYSVPVGISESMRSQVFACESMCAPAVGYRPPVGEQLGLLSMCSDPACDRCYADAYDSELYRSVMRGGS